MQWDPKNFFVGLADFFTILLPGAILVFATGTLFSDALPRTDGLLASELGQWLLVFGFSYLAGHLLFLAGSVLDFLVYDPLERLSLAQQIEQMSLRKRAEPSRRLARTLARIVNKDVAPRDHCVGAACALRDQSLAHLTGPRAMNAYQWAKLWLAEDKCEEHLAKVHRFEIDSKFFRSFAVLVPFVGVLWLVSLVLGASELPGWRTSVVVVAAATLLFVAALSRYAEQRGKAFTHACRAAVVHAATSGGTLDREQASMRAGGVVYRRATSGLEFLAISPAPLLDIKAEELNSLVETDRAPWILPKGHIEPGEMPVTAAVREVYEEAGCWTRPIAFLGVFEYGPVKDGGGKRCAYFLLEFAGEGKKPEPGRAIKWLPVETSIADLPSDNTLVLRAAQTALSGPGA